MHGFCEHCECELIDGPSWVRVARLRVWAARETDGAVARTILARILAPASRAPGVLVLARSAGALWERNAFVVARIMAEVQAWPFVADPAGSKDLVCDLATTRDVGGDCEDKAKAVVVLTRTAGIPADFRWVVQREYDLDHVSALVELAPHRWAWAETTIAAGVGEAPIKAASRLGLMGGNDGLGARSATR